MGHLSHPVEEFMREHRRRARLVQTGDHVHALISDERIQEWIGTERICSGRFLDCRIEVLIIEELLQKRRAVGERLWHRKAPSCCAESCPVSISRRTLKNSILVP